MICRDEGRNGFGSTRELPGSLMITLNLAYFPSLLSVALTLTPAMAHLLELFAPLRQLPRSEDLAASMSTAR